MAREASERRTTEGQMASRGTANGLSANDRTMNNKAANKARREPADTGKNGGGNGAKEM
ncbi:hypothetical protein HOY80DRAFT_1048716 [Tuber brumale]|nr:hypothetical protein HOY80DRAFT_1048716 [Tuber brumale]